MHEFLEKVVVVFTVVCLDLVSKFATLLNEIPRFSLNAAYKHFLQHTVFGAPSAANENLTVNLQVVWSTCVAWASAFTLSKVNTEFKIYVVTVLQSKWFATIPSVLLCFSVICIFVAIYDKDVVECPANCRIDIENHASKGVTTSAVETQIQTAIHKTQPEEKSAGVRKFATEKVASFIAPIFKFFLIAFHHHRRKS